MAALRGMTVTSKIATRAGRSGVRSCEAHFDKRLKDPQAVAEVFAANRMDVAGDGIPCGRRGRGIFENVEAKRAL